MTNIEPTSALAKCHTRYMHIPSLPLPHRHQPSIAHCRCHRFSCVVFLLTCRRAPSGRRRRRGPRRRRPEHGRPRRRRRRRRRPEPQRRPGLSLQHCVGTPQFCGLAVRHGRVPGALLPLSSFSPFLPIKSKCIGTPGGAARISLALGRNS